MNIRFSENRRKILLLRHRLHRSGGAEKRGLDDQNHRGNQHKHGNRRTDASERLLSEQQHGRVWFIDYGICPKRSDAGRLYENINESANNIIDSGPVVILAIKNISAYELNISTDELMERFKRGDESRSSQGSGLGLSIAKSLVEIQKGCFNIEIDGDLFKAIIQMNKGE